MNFLEIEDILINKLDCDESVRKLFNVSENVKVTRSAEYIPSTFIIIYKSSDIFLEVGIMQHFVDGRTYHYNKNGPSLFFVDKTNISVTFHSSLKLLSMRHRPTIEGPAFIRFNRIKRIITQEVYYTNGVPHNSVGPAFRNFIFDVWDNKFYINGAFISRENFFIRNKL